MTAAVTLFEQLRGRLAVRPALILLDVDGTLSPIAPTPTAAFVPAATRSAVAQLTAAPGVHVALVSGRAARDALCLVGVDGVWAIGNHGFERITPVGDLEEDASASPWREHVAAAAASAMALVNRLDGALLEDKTWTLSIHYRQAAAEVEPELRAALADIAAREGLVLTNGKKVFEVRPPVHVNKGTASVALVSALFGTGDGVALYAGDDRTDEDAFVALRAGRPSTITIRIAPAAQEAPSVSAAEFVLPDVGAMGAFLVLLADSTAVRA